VSGGIVAGLVFLLFNAMFKKTQSSSESHVASLPGQEASIITPIPENGVGEIAYVQAAHATRRRRETRAASLLPQAKPSASAASSAPNFTWNHQTKPNWQPERILMQTTLTPILAEIGTVPLIIGAVAAVLLVILMFIVIWGEPLHQSRPRTKCS